MIRPLVVAAILSVAPVAHAFAQGTGAGNRGKDAAARAAHADLETTILALETKRIDAMVKKDLKVLYALLGDDLSYTHSGGTSDTKASFIALIRDRGRYLGVDYSGTRVIPWGGNAVIVRGRARVRLEDTAPYSVFFLDVWALREGTWKMVAWQATRIPE